MAKMVNVNREVQDSFYRYKMPMIICKIEGRGNGIKTAIPNMVDIAKALDRPPSYPTKYLGVELGAQTQMYPADERYIVNGAFEADRFQDVLDGFIKKFVLCAGCNNPETVLRVTKKKEIESACKACGHRCFLPLSHKLSTFIINNPPDGSGATSGKKGRSKEERRRAKRGEASTEDGDGDGGDENDEEASVAESGGGDIAPEAELIDDEEDLEWSVDTSEEAARQRAAELGGGVSGLTMTNDLEKPMSERLQIFENFVIAKMGEAQFPAKAVVSEAERLDCKDKGVMVLVGTLIKEGDVYANLKQHQGLFQRFTYENPKAEKNCLSATEKLLESRPELVSQTPRIFKTLYDLDIVDEEQFIKWAKKASKKNVGSAELAAKIQAAAKPFIDWLIEADEEESDEEEEEEVVAFETAQEQAAKEEEEAVEAPAEAAAEEEDDDDDLDIDNI